MAAVRQKAKTIYYEELGLTQEHLPVFLYAVFSIAITLLVLEVSLDVPLNATDGEIIGGLIAAIPAATSYTNI